MAHPLIESKPEECAMLKPTLMLHLHDSDLLNDSCFTQPSDCSFMVAQHGRPALSRPVSGFTKAKAQLFSVALHGLEGCNAGTVAGFCR